MTDAFVKAYAKFHKDHGTKEYSYSADGEGDGPKSPKAKMHNAAKRLLRQLALELGYKKDEFDVRSNLGGVAVMGESTLHTDRLYVQLCASFSTQREMQFLVRSCKHRKDYSGGANNFCTLRSHNPEVLFELCKRETRREPATA